MQENWAYTFDNLALQTRRMFTNKEEWIKKNQWFADNYEQELGSTVHILDVYVFPSALEADVRIQLTFKDGSRLAPRDTRFVYQETSWKHLFLKEKRGTPAFLLGVIAETRHAPIRTPAGVYPSFAGLGLAFDASTIRDTMELFSFD